MQRKTDNGIVIECEAHITSCPDCKERLTCQAWDNKSLCPCKDEELAPDGITIRCKDCKTKLGEKITPFLNEPNKPVKENNLFI